MRWSDVTARPTERRLREFAATLAVVSTAVAGWRAIGGTSAQVGWAAALGLAAVALGVWRPRWLAPVFMAGMIVAFPIAWTISLLVSALVFYGMLTPLAILFRLVGRDALQRRPQPRQNSYWLEKPAAQGPGRYLRQF